LSRRPRTESDDIDEANEVDIEDFIDAELNAFSVALIVAEGSSTSPTGFTDKDLLEDGYLEDSWQIARYLTSLKKLEGMSRSEFWNFRRKALLYAVADGNLYWKAGKTLP